MEQGMSLEQYREAVKSGVNLLEEPAQEVREDAVPVEQEQEIEQEPQDVEIEQETVEPEQEADIDPIPQEQQSAWAKRAERERRKGAEETETRLKSEYETQLNPYKAFFDKLGIDPQKAMEALEQQQINQEATRLAEYNGWDEQQTQMYMRQQDLERKQTEMSVNLRLYELAETPDYPGIKQMKGAITEFIRANPRVSVEQAYFAVGGANLSAQIKREFEQRAILKRSQTKRTVVSDAPATMTGPAPLPPEAVEFMRQNRMSEAQVRDLMRDDYPKDLESYRKMRRK